MTSEAGHVSPSRRLELVTDPADELTVTLADGARAQYMDGDLRASRQNFERAYQLAERAGDVRAMALAALGLAGLWVSERRTSPARCCSRRGSSMSFRCSTRTPARASRSGPGWRERPTTCRGEQRGDPGRAGEARAAGGSGAAGRGAEPGPSLPARPGARQTAPGPGRRADQGELPHRDAAATC